ncbi:MAG: hypothetical protein A3C47_01900 [Omnitrophica bacterium RIFCSPHIGHO2_02_FULL_51_18]|nr:MAG: hypothetical protein A3C47_01900 [Omnitrophica bacterium RIFCSPHIGHO2_02_FULL_51_18]
MILKISIASIVLVLTLAVVACSEVSFESSPASQIFAVRPSGNLLFSPIVSMTFQVEKPVVLPKIKAVDFTGDILALRTCQSSS